MICCKKVKKSQIHIDLKTSFNEQNKMSMDDLKLALICTGVNKVKINMKTSCI